MTSPLLTKSEVPDAGGSAGLPRLRHTTDTRQGAPPRYVLLVVLEVREGRAPGEEGKMIRYQGMLCVVIGGETVSVAPCTIDEQGGVFTTKETDRMSAKRTIDHWRVGSLSKERLAQIEDDA